MVPDQYVLLRVRRLARCGDVLSKTVGEVPNWPMAGTESH